MVSAALNQRTICGIVKCHRSHIRLTKVVEVMLSLGRSLRYTLRILDGTVILIDLGGDDGDAGEFS